MTRYHDHLKTPEEISPDLRMQLRYRPHSGPHQGKDVELPLKMLVTGDFKGYREENTPLTEREAVNITPENFNAIIEAANITITLSGDPSRTLKIRSLDDFHPDRIAKQLPETRFYLRTRQLLVELKNHRLTSDQRRAIVEALREELNLTVEANNL